MIHRVVRAFRPVSDRPGQAGIAVRGGVPAVRHRDRLSPP
jgi:hypothetical protein